MACETMVVHAESHGVTFTGPDSAWTPGVFKTGLARTFLEGLEIFTGVHTGR